jgi:uroporphyrinogen decarboxylase
MPMTSRQRVLAAIHHEEPDRVPIVFGVSNATSLKAKPYRQVKKLLGFAGEDRYLYDWPELGSIASDERILERMHSDVRGVLDRMPQDVIQRNRNRPPHTPFIDDWGIGQVEYEPDVWFPSLHPLQEATRLDELERYVWPDMNDPTRVAHVREQARELAAAGEYAILATPWLLFPFERAIAMQGMEAFFSNLVENRDFSLALLHKIAALCKTLMGHFLRELGEDVDIIKIGDDLGMQTGLLISPRMYREFLKPIHADYIAFIKERTKAKIFFHTDGDVFDLIPDFIEIGVDILNPIQTSAGKMSDLEGLKRQYGKQICFCGAIDTFRVLPYGTPEEVRQEVRRVIHTLAPGGGYLLAAVHTILDEVPGENVLAMADAAEEFGGYPIRG